MDTWKQLKELAQQRRRGEATSGQPVTLRTLRPLFLFFGGFLALTLVAKILAPRPGRETQTAHSAAGAPPAAAGSADAPAPPARNDDAESTAALALFSPATNLETKEGEAIGYAHQTLDVAMDRFTDMALARRLIMAQARGVVVRVYRDRAEYEREEGARGVVSTTALLRSGGVEVRVKSAAAGPMSLRACDIDRGLLRTGSASWTAASLAEPEQAVFYAQSAAASAQFEHEFERMWTRPDNTVVP